MRGNHDKVACGLEQAEGFNAVAKSAAKWTLDVLTPAHRDWLCALPAGPIDVDEVVEICHGSPFDEDAYIFDELDAVRALKVSNRPLCLFGHTHYPVTFELSEDSFESIGSGDDAADCRCRCAPARRYSINPGSVGQPRDGDPRAAYAIVDTKLHRVELYRTRYAVDEAQNKVLKAGLPLLAGRARCRASLVRGRSTDLEVGCGRFGRARAVADGGRTVKGEVEKLEVRKETLNGPGVLLLLLAQRVVAA